MTEEIDIYLKGGLSESERVTFEKRMQEDEAFASEVKEQLKAEYVVRKAAQAAQKAGLKQVYHELVMEGEVTLVKPLYQRPALWAAAAAVAILLVAIRFFTLPPRMDAQELYAAYVTAAPISFTRGAQDGTLAQLSSRYQEADYTAVVEIAKQLLQDSAYSPSPKLVLSLAISQLMLQQPEAALESFKLIPHGSAFDEQVQWYEALAWLRLDSEQARTRLKAIAAGQHYQRETAKEILSKWKE